MTPPSPQNFELSVPPGGHRGHTGHSVHLTQLVNRCIAMAEIYVAQLPSLTFDAVAQEVIDAVKFLLEECIQSPFPTPDTPPDYQAAEKFLDHLFNSETECNVMKELCKDWLRQRNARLTAKKGLEVDV